MGVALVSASEVRILRFKVAESKPAVAVSGFRVPFSSLRGPSACIWFNDRWTRSGLNFAEVEGECCTVFLSAEEFEFGISPSRVVTVIPSANPGAREAVLPR